jgi:hypothetical protein
MACSVEEKGGGKRIRLYLPAQMQSTNQSGDKGNEENKIRLTLIFSTHKMAGS